MTIKQLSFCLSSMHPGCMPIREGADKLPWRRRRRFTISFIHPSLNSYVPSLSSQPSNRQKCFKLLNRDFPGSTTSRPTDVNPQLSGLPQSTSKTAYVPHNNMCATILESRSVWILYNILPYLERGTPTLCTSSTLESSDSLCTTHDAATKNVFNCAEHSHFLGR